MNLIKTISLFSTIIFFSINLYSQDINSAEKNKLLIFNFITTDKYDDIKEKEKNFNYYSIVIPETISKTLNKSGNFEISREEGPFTIESDFKDIKEKRKYIKKLTDLGQQNKSDYIITGTFNVVADKLTIRITIFNVKGKDIEIVDHVSEELGAQMQETTDLLSQRIKENVEKLDKINQERSNRSPFIALYKPFSIITIGVDSGYLYIKGKWSSLYNNTLYISPFIDFDLTENFALSLKFSSIQSDSENKDSLSYSQIGILSSSMALCYTYRFNSSFGFGMSAGGGVSRTTIIINPDKPFEDSLSEKKSTDPNIDISSYFVYNSPTLVFRAGVLYKRIFFKDEPMDAGVIFAGAGIHF